MADEEVFLVGAMSTSRPIKLSSDTETEKFMSLWQDEEVLFNCRHQHYFKGYATQNAINRISSQIEKEDDIYDNFQRPRAAFPATIPYISYSY